MRIGSSRHPLCALGMAWMCLVAGAVPAAAQQPEPSHTLIRPERVFDAATGEVRTGWAEISSLDSPSVAGDLDLVPTQLTERIQ
jgi:hypothetical protein